MELTGRPLVAAMCIGQLGSLLPHVTVPAIMAQSLMPLWGLSATEAGVMASALAFGYMLAVPVLTTLTDRIDARLILAAGSALSGLATIGFGVFAEGVWSATLIWGIAGVGFAGVYMPGSRLSLIGCRPAILPAASPFIQQAFRSASGSRFSWRRW
jgi:MFS family permease